ncbi:endonuclease V [Nocardia cyriacigeorgica]|jgi:deoxyribonuclease V|uniref:endonuclease V n=1 Tax=Nocardia cyriacigeorgica TaxID=135487 RepID=UPI00031B5279|nr:endonuclease V [Nocardia cyriacigeorgica]AVH22528.1 endonuclease V [Nocardia cyriacigeorgica]MBF6322177.1 endonuclease V [Nocardia cyriacigeorgica]TLF56912.1 endonuclease V [Nocardia cyriacigeorgica]
MRLTRPDRWPASAAEATAMQDELRPLVRAENPRPPRFRTIAGLDSAYHDDGTVAAAIVVVDAATLDTVDTTVAYGTATFPYIPGLLSFREMPTTVTALEQLTTTPDLLVCDAQGLAHPRRFGFACHVGVVTGVPTIGVAKSAWGDCPEPGPERGAQADITIDGEIVGRVLRTRTGVKPVFVSVGHLIDLDTACAQVLALTSKYRLPETTRRADQLCRRALQNAIAH